MLSTFQADFSVVVVNWQQLRGVFWVGARKATAIVLPVASQKASKHARGSRLVDFKVDSLAPVGRAAGESVVVKAGLKEVGCGVVVTGQRTCDTHVVQA